MLFRCVVFFFILISCVPALPKEEISRNEAKLLLPFFKSILSNTEAGYVFYDKKPLCVGVFSQNTCPFFPLDLYQVSSAVLLAKDVINQPLFQSGKIAFRFYEKEGIFIIVNREIFLQTVRENLTLFQYVLGPFVTPEKLLDQLLSTQDAFLSVFNNDKVLTGIVLGYGTQNALFHSRLENINEILISRDELPFIPIVNSCSDCGEQDLLLFLPNEIESFDDGRKHLKPSFGFSSLKEEMKEIDKRMNTSSDLLLNETPNFIFGCLKEEKSSLDLLKELESTQKKINNLLQSSDFLSDILKIVADREVTIQSPEISAFACDEDINVAIAKVLKIDFQEYEFEPQYLNFFMKGLLNEKVEMHQTKVSELVGCPKILKSLYKAKNNLDNADIFFMHLSKNKDFKTISEKFLYYKILQDGNGEILQDEISVVLDLDVFDPSGRCLKALSNCKIDLRKIIPGLALGIKGMKIGEKRLLYIHPQLAYGVHTHLEKGIYLKIFVELKKKEEIKAPLPTYVPIDFSFIQDAQFHRECEEVHRKTVYEVGKMRGDFLRLCPGLDLSKVAEALKNLKPEDKLSINESEAVNKFFWNVYFADSHSNVAKSTH